MSEVPTYVLDASVAFKWLVQLDDEPHNEQALAAIGDYQTGRLNLIAPAVLDYEVGHALRTAVRRERITHQQGSEIYRLYRELDVPLVDQHAFLSHIWRTAAVLDCGFYDASYAWLAADRRFPLLCADDKLHSKLVAGSVASVWIADYHSTYR
jgi:predicted nucleic acid-binding protein